jgi:hypothetical protein
VITATGRSASILDLFPEKASDHWIVVLEKTHAIGGADCYGTAFAIL